MSLAVQVRLLRVLQERELERVGGNRTVKVDIRVIAATHRDLEGMVRAGQFRQDLFFRLNVVPIGIPPLRARPGIWRLSRHFVGHFCRQVGKRLDLSVAAIGSLTRYDWPGNVRELRNAVERAVKVLADGSLVLEPDDFSFDMAAVPSRAPRAVGSMGTSIFEEIAEAEAETIRDALRKAGGSVTRHGSWAFRALR